jgi:hypothetical protein
MRPVMRPRVKNRPSRPGTVRTPGSHLLNELCAWQEFNASDLLSAADGSTVDPKPPLGGNALIGAILVWCACATPRSESPEADLQLKELFRSMYNTSTLSIFSRIYGRCCHSHRPLVEVVTALHSFPAFFMFRLFLGSCDLVVFRF